MERDLTKKLQSENPLSVEDALALDEALANGRGYAQLLSHMTDESPSLAWRSSLNARLAAESSKHKKVIAFRWFSGLVTTCAAAALAVVVLPTLNRKPTIASTPIKPAVTHEGPSVEESLVSAHKEADLENSMGVSWTQVDYEQASGS